MGGGTNFISRIKEQETHLILHEHDDDDDDELQMGCHPVAVVIMRVHKYEIEKT